MILKTNEGRAEDIEALEALLTEGVTPEQCRAIETELYAIRQGGRGERETAHILDRMYGHSDRVAVLHDVRLPDGLGGHVQFDHLLFNRVLKRIAVLETKNFSGRISKNEHNEWCVWYPRKRHPVEIPNPVAQANRAAKLLQLWLEAHQHSAAFRRVEGWVIVPPTCKIDRTRIGNGTRIVKVDNFHDRWVEDVGIMDTTGFLTGLSVEQLRAVATQLAAQHVPPAFAWRKRFGMSDTDQLPTEQVANASIDHGAVLEPEDTPTEITERPQDGQAIETVTVTAPPPEPCSDSGPCQLEGVYQIGSDLPKREPETKRDTSTSKATALVPVTDGISERMLPDGRIAFLATPGTPAAERLSTVCKGRAIWNPRFRNWLCSSERAVEIREALVAQAIGEPS